MGRVWTDEMQADLERWQANQAEASSPVDFLIVKPGFRDVVRGLLSFVVAAIRYQIFGGYQSPWTLAQQIEFASIEHGLGRTRVAEIEEWLEEELDFFADADCYRA